MRITLNLATRPYADLKPAIRRLRIGMAVLVVLGGALYLGLRAVHQKAEDARATEQQVQNKIDAINRERQGYQDMMRQPANDQLLKQAGALNQIFDVKTFSWTLAMEDLETVLPGGVQVTTLEPARDTKTGVISLKLRVVGPRDKADDLVQNLEHSKHFLLPHIVSESSESTGSGRTEQLEPVSASNRFSFEIQAEYNSAAPAESKAEKKPDEEKPAATEGKAKAAGKSAPPRKTGTPSLPPAARPSLPQPVPPSQPGGQLQNGPGRKSSPGRLKPSPISSPGGVQ